MILRFTSSHHQGPLINWCIPTSKTLQSTLKKKLSSKPMRFLFASIKFIDESISHLCTLFVLHDVFFMIHSITSRLFVETFKKTTKILLCDDFCNFCYHFKWFLCLSLGNSSVTRRHLAPRPFCKRRKYSWWLLVLMPWRMSSNIAHCRDNRRSRREKGQQRPCRLNNGRIKRIDKGESACARTLRLSDSYKTIISKALPTCVRDTFMIAEN